MYIVKSIIKEKQVELLQKANKSCLNETTGRKQSISGLYCNQTFDNLVCWPDTKAGTVAEQNCPNYINNFNTRGKARRECLPNGQWYVHPFYNRTWTDFSECRSKTEPPNPLKDHLPILSRLCVVGYIVSLACLFVAVCLMVRFRRLHCQRNVIHTNLFVSFILRSIICLVKEVFHTPDGRSSVVNNIATLMTEGSTWQCKLVFSLFNYIILANYMWIFIEGFYLHNLIFISAFEKSRRFHLYILAGWLLPLLCVIPWILVRRFLEDTLCWSTHTVENKFVWIIRGPIVASIVVNFIFFINIIRVIFTKLTASHVHDKHRYRKLARSTLVLIPLFGVYYMISVVMPECMDPDVELVWLYTEGGVNSFQGFLIALLFCFLNGEVRKEARGLKRLHFTGFRFSRKYAKVGTGSVSYDGSVRHRGPAELCLSGQPCMPKT
ncbi:parathyroid hormone/parathyroid hormone-related peptide receptor-like isoform X2 [Ostrea edulis]|uniref:parathyroid hormone/parathyroid hormone-related peptide receptor-like isoform X2 n=1 Tax=Ostrea edulis TaxID=37623 RepID=UPI0024AFE218|nr:parathyroid hormone/parathyroid hormone-related peptide receptor-like isoform X2 [Ostrea edulis]